MLLLLLSVLQLTEPKQSYKVGFTLDLRDVAYINSYKAIINLAITKFNSESSELSLQPEIRAYNGSSFYQIVTSTCSLVEEGVIMVISPDISDNIGIQADVLSRVNMPLLSSAATDPNLERGSHDKLFLMSPSDSIQAHVIVDLLTKYGWTKLSIIASDSDYGINGVTTLQQLLTETTAKVTVQEEFEVDVFFFNAAAGPTQMELKDIMELVIDSLERVFVLHCEGHYGRWVLNAAHEHGLLREEFVWIVTESITTSPESLKVDRDGELNVFYPTYYEGLLGIAFDINSQTERYQALRKTALDAGLRDRDLTSVVFILYDTILLAAQSLQDNHDDLKLNPLVANVSCHDDTPSVHGDTIERYLRSTDYIGPTGNYNFREGSMIASNNPQYKIVNFVNHGEGSESSFTTVGTWSTQKRLHISSPNIEFLGKTNNVPRGVANTLEGQHLKIGVVVGVPFADANKSGNCSGISCWSGICPDIIRRLAADLHFTYEFLEPEDGSYSSYGYLDETTGLWTGLVGDLLRNRIDLIGMDLSVGSQRRSYIDFTFSYLDSGISVVIKGESKTNNRFFFLSPFGLSTWAAILIAIVLTSVYQTVLHKLSPYDQHGLMAYATTNCTCAACADADGQMDISTAPPCLVTSAQSDLDMEVLSLNNALWVIGGGFVGQSGDPLPRSPSGRVILLTWWFFVMLISQMYGANLTAFMTLDKQGVPLNKPQDLLDQQEYKWGLQHHSITADLLKNHIDKDFQLLAEQSSNVESFQGGVERVYPGKFALIEDTLWLQYNTSNQCDIFFVGEKIITIPVAFGLPMGSPYARLFNKQILQYREEGYFKDLWDLKGRGRDECGKETVGNDESLEFSTLIGIFYFLFLGLLIGASLLVIEIVVAVVRDPCKDKGFLRRLVARLKMAFVSAHFQGKRNEDVVDGNVKC